MKRMFFERERITQAAAVLFGEREDYDARRYEDYDSLEVAAQEDGRYSVWGNRGEEADLLRDTRPDRTGVLRQLDRLADDVEEDSDMPEDDPDWDEEEESECN